MTDTEKIADVVVAAVRADTAPLLERIAALEARPVIKDAGVWRSGAVYQAGALVSHGGSGWICHTAHVSTGTEPSHDCFRLFVKAGRDAKGTR